MRGDTGGRTKVDLLIPDDVFGGVEHAPGGGFQGMPILLRDDGVVRADEALVAACLADSFVERVLQVSRIGQGQICGGLDLLIFGLLRRFRDGPEVGYELLGTWHASLLAS